MNNEDLVIRSTHRLVPSRHIVIGLPRFTALQRLPVLIAPPRWQRGCRSSRPSTAQANHDIDRAVAMGELDAAGPVLHVEGTMEELVAAVMRIPMNRAEAERLTDKAIRRRFPRPAIGLAALAIIVALAH
jgi:hypothetical protein